MPITMLSGSLFKGGGRGGSGYDRIVEVDEESLKKDSDGTKDDSKS